jgi:LuxR family maltose regulon positive regulatory protein
VISAPAGYGKTTLLEAWAAHDLRPVRWASGASSDAVAASLERVACEVGDASVPVAVAVDGAGDADDPNMARELARMARIMPPGSLVVVATRRPALRPVGGLRAREQVIELGARELALTPAEAATTLRSLGVHLRDRTAARLLERLDGWPVAVMLAALSLREVAAGQIDAAAATFDGTDRFIAEYVRDELLDPLDPRLLAFLRRCTVIDSLDPELCAVLGGRGDVPAALDELRAAGLPLLGRERDGSRLQCHPLVCDVLRSDLDLREPRMGRALRTRAAAWFEDRGQSERALELHLAAGNADGAAALLWPLAASYVWDERVDRVEAWLGRFPVRRLERHAGLAAVMAAVQLGCGRLDHAHRWATLSLSAGGAVSDPLGRSVRQGAEAMRALTGLGDLQDLPGGLTEVIAATRELLDPWRALLAFAHGAAAALVGREELAQRWLREGARAGLVDAPGIAALCEAQLAMMNLCAGDWANGACLAERARGRVERVALPDHPLLGLAAAAAAFARAHRGRFEEARADVAVVRRVLDAADTLPPWLEAELLLAASRAELRLSEIGAAREHLRRADDLAGAVPQASALHAWIADGRRFADAATEVALPGADPLTGAELRVLRFLPSHLSFREIGGRLYVSPNTIKTQAHAVYRKLGAVSRSEAVDQATLLGLLDPDPRTSSPWGDARVAGAS